jgi:hypothetical protein
MNLQDWIQYRRICPLCEGTLSTYLHSTKKQGSKIEGGRLLITFPMYETNKQVKYIVGYFFDLYSSSFFIDFYDKDNIKLEKESPIFLMNKFRKFNTNLGYYAFYRHCDTCQRYYYSSTNFKLDFTSSILVSPDKWATQVLEVSTEYFGFIQLLKSEKEKPYRIFQLLNFYPQDKCSLTYWSSDDPAVTYQKIPLYAEHIYLPLIRFVSLEETLNRLKKLLVFL